MSKDRYTSRQTIIRDNVEYGCHIDLCGGEEPDACVIDLGEHESCVFGVFSNGKKRRSQWTCKYWKPVQPKGDTQ